jgi:hypothetical protein
VGRTTGLDAVEKNTSCNFINISLYTRAIRKLNSDELITKQAMRKKNVLYKKYVHT